MRFLVDADACPVKDEIVRVAERHGAEVVLVGNQWLRDASRPGVRMILVGRGMDAADDRIAAEAGPADIVVTADVPLAARCVDRRARVVRPDGRTLDARSIGMAHALRDLGAHLRETGAMTGGPPPFARKDRLRFLDALEAAAQAVRRGR
jgi:uncharacterized protein